MTTFSHRLSLLPRLGLGVSTEYGAGDQPGALDPARLREAHNYADFLEIGLEVAKGPDAHARAWAARGWPSTYHFLDVNLDDAQDLGADWLAAVRSLQRQLRPAWLCGDAGLWHLGGRDRGQMLLLPPILEAWSIPALAAGIRALREATGLEVLPENPPGSAFVGRMHLLEYFSRLAEAADTGLVLDCAHLTMFQRSRGLSALDGFDNFDFSRVIELHIAGGSPADHEGLPWVDDDHGLSVLPETWAITEALCARCPNLRAVIVECERNSLDGVLPLFDAVARRLPAGFRPETLPAPGPLPPQAPARTPKLPDSRRSHRLQAEVVRLAVDPEARAALDNPKAFPGIPREDWALLQANDPRAYATDRHRRDRLLTLLAGECPVTVAALGLPLVDSWFSTEDFARFLAGRGSLPVAFAASIAASHHHPEVTPFANLEAEIARTRREQPDPRPGIVKRPGLRFVSLPTGTLARWSEARSSLGEPVEAGVLLHQRRFYPERAPNGLEHLLIERDEQGQIQISTASIALGRLLCACEQPRPRPKVLADARRLGAGQEAAEVVDGLIADGLLLAQAAHPG